jgi:hypothetical protein
MSLRGLPSHLPTPLPRLCVAARYPNSSSGGVCRPGDLKIIINLSPPPAKIPSNYSVLATASLASSGKQPSEERERERERIYEVALSWYQCESCLLVLNSVTSTPQWIRQPQAAWLCVWCLRAWCVCVQVCARTFSGLLASEPPVMPPPAPWLSHFALCLPDLPRTPP